VSATSNFPPFPSYFTANFGYVTSHTDINISFAKSVYIALAKARINPIAFFIFVLDVCSSPLNYFITVIPKVKVLYSFNISDISGSIFLTFLGCRALEAKKGKILKISLGRKLLSD
jgi:hypothetical protein